MCVAGIPLEFLICCVRPLVLWIKAAEGGWGGWGGGQGRFWAKLGEISPIPALNVSSVK